MNKKIALFREGDINSKADKPVALISGSKIEPRKTGEPGEKPSEQDREPTTNSTHI